MNEPRLTGDPAVASSPARAPARWQRPELVIWGAHGGAATTTLANWLQPAWDMGTMPPEPDPSYPAAITRGRALVVACRNTVWSALQATKAVNVVKRQGGHVAVLAVVSDSWPEPAAARGPAWEPGWPRSPPDSAGGWRICRKPFRPLLPACPACCDGSVCLPGLAPRARGDPVPGAVRRPGQARAGSATGVAVHHLHQMII